MISLSPELSEITQSVALLDFIITMMLIKLVLFYKELLKTFLRLLIAKKLI